jgi:ABC-2 type transport system ATP-binding protein
MAKDIAIKVQNVGKDFRLPHERISSLKQAALNFHKRRYETFKVLDGVSFDIKEGEFFGILGRNGSGKSTLLKLLAGIYSPTHGQIQVNGTLTPFIELGVGFNAELTGRENVFLNGAILGLTNKEIKEKYDEIVAFAELERFMDQKLKNYSSGMQVRLAFAIAIQAHNSILLIDEVLAVGDESFQDKCLKVFSQIKKDGKKTVVFVSHDMASVQRFCDRAIVIHAGKLVYEGKPSEAVLQYRKLNFPETIIEEDGKKQSVVGARLTGSNGRARSTFKYGETAVMHVEWKPDDRIKNIGVAVFKDDDYYMNGTNTMIDGVKIKGNKLDYEFTLNLGGGHYYTRIGFFGETAADKIYFINSGPIISMESDNTWQGVSNLPHKWKQ